MRKGMAVLLFVITCMVLALLLLAKVVKIVFGGLVFALALIIFGLLSRGFKKGS